MCSSSSLNDEKIKVKVYALILFLKILKAEDLSKIEFKKHLSLATKESCFIFNGNLCKQVNGVAMGSPLALILVFLYTLKRIGYKIVHLTLSLIITDSMLMIFCFVYLTRTFGSL